MFHEKKYLDFFISSKLWIWRSLFEKYDSELNTKPLMDFLKPPIIPYSEGQSGLAFSFTVWRPIVFLFKISLFYAEFRKELWVSIL